MTVAVAMALSGIEREQWGDFKELYDQGAQVGQYNSSRRTRWKSTKMGYPSSTCTNAEVSNSVIPETLQDYCRFKMEVMGFSDQEANHAFQLLGVAEASAETNTEADPRSQQSTSKSQSNAPIESVLKPFYNYEHLTKIYEPLLLPLKVKFKKRKQKAETPLAQKKPNPMNKTDPSVKNEELEQVPQTGPSSDATKTPKRVSENPPYPVNTGAVMFGGRNIVDLASNLQGNPTFFQPTPIPQTTNTEVLYDNRSQIHRLANHKPPNTSYICTCLDCGFESYGFYN